MILRALKFNHHPVWHKNAHQMLNGAWWQLRSKIEEQTNNYQIKNRIFWSIIGAK